MKLNKNQKNIFWLVLGSSILLGASLGIGLKNKIEFIDTNSSETMINKNAFVYDGPVLERDSVIALGWDQKETITLADWRTSAPSVVVIGNGAFQGNQVLKSIEIPTKISVIHHSSFKNSSLERIFFNDNSIKNIGDEAFANSNLKSIDIPYSITHIGSNVFNGTNFLEGAQIKIPAKFRYGSSIPKYGFTQTQWDTISWKHQIIYSEILSMDDVINLGWDMKTTITLDDWMNWAPNVIQLGGGGFGNRAPFFENKTLQLIQIPDKVEIIGEDSFNSSSLTSIEFSSGSQLREIHLNSFASSSITSINIPNSVTQIGENAFLNTNSLTQVTMPLTLKQNSSSPLYGFTQEQWDGINWTSNTFQGEILTKNDIINLRWDKKTTITLADWTLSAPNVIQIGFDSLSGDFNNSPFSSNTILQSIEIPAKITAINHGAFYSNSSLRTITFEENSKLLQIGKSAFEGTGITELILPSSVEIIEDSAFKNTNSLEGDKISMSINLSKNLETPLYGFSQEQWDLINWFSPKKDLTKIYIFVGSLSGALILLLAVNVLIILKLKK